jgi:hypothetical protein
MEGKSHFSKLNRVFCGFSLSRDDFTRGLPRDLPRHILSGISFECLRVCVGRPSGAAEAEELSFSYGGDRPDGFEDRG